MYFENPIFSGDYPDPSIVRVGDDYYVTHSTFTYIPGLLVWHSTDVINWRPLTYALHQYVGSVYAPDIVHHAGRFYIYFPAGGTNWVVTAERAEGPWSLPIDLKIGHIDPGHITDADGNRYLFMSGGYMVPLAADGLSVTGPAVRVYEGWRYPRDWAVGSFSLESPKLFFKDGYYYMTVAEGGTAGPATCHMAACARARELCGPWENSPYNPIVHTWSRDELWHAKGHGTVFEDANGGWWILYHAYEKEYCNMGRQTLLEPLEWTRDGWFKLPEKVKCDMPLRLNSVRGEQLKNRIICDDPLRQSSLSLMWQFYACCGGLSAQPTDKGVIIEDAMLTVIPVDHSYQVEVTAQISEGAEAGLLLYYCDAARCGIGFTADKSFVYRRERIIAPSEHSLNTARLRVVNIRNEVSVYIDKLDGTGYVKAEPSVDISGYSHVNFDGFVGIRVGLLAKGGKAVFSDFKYEPLKDR